TYQLFLDRVAAGRNRTKEEIHQVAQGRVWSGDDAVEAGLVDTIGDLDLALNLAAKGAGYDDDFKVLTYPVIETTFYEELLKSIGEMENVKAVLGLKKPKILNQKILDMVELISEKQLATPQCRLPFVLEVH
ncbi:MAG: S49 family peptidase, partial [Saprospiraceae bacterium]|nr:S49 family peptidase [Saprospiraceae bacterium]